MGNPRGCSTDLLPEWSVLKSWSIDVRVFMQRTSKEEVFDPKVVSFLSGGAPQPDRIPGQLLLLLRIRAGMGGGVTIIPARLTSHPCPKQYSLWVKP